MTKIKLDALVESFSSSFGRIIEIGTCYFIVKFPYCRNEERTFSIDDFNKGLYNITIH